MASKFDAKEWFLKLSTENRFIPKKKKVNEKMCYVVNSGFVANYATLENDMHRRQVRAFLLKSFKSPACKHREFSRMNDAQLKEFMEAQEAYVGRTTVKESTGKRRLKALPEPVKPILPGLNVEPTSEVCQAYKILNGLLDGIINEAMKSQKIPVSIHREYMRLVSVVKKCAIETPEAGLYEPLLAFFAEHLPVIKLSGPFLKHLRSYPPDLKKVKSFVGSVQRGTKVLHTSILGGVRTRKNIRIRKVTMKK